MQKRSRFEGRKTRIVKSRKGQEKVSVLREDTTVLAIFLADIHLSLKAPIWRSAEEDWLSVQVRPLKEVRLLQKKYDCPVICAGDVFDRNKKISDGWDASPELINFALDELPDNIYAIPGQHDLPNHQYSDIHRSAYWTLVRAGKIKNIVPGDVTIAGDCLSLFGFPPGYGIEPFSGCQLKFDGSNTVMAVVHDYVWMTGYSYPNAPSEKRVEKITKDFRRKVAGYDVIVHGDNHKGFSTRIGTTQIFNCGTLMRRKSDEIDYEPQVGLLLETGEVVAHKLDVSQDKYIDIVETGKQDDEGLDMGEFFEELEKLGDSAIDFKESMLEFLRSKKTSAGAKGVIIKAMEKADVQI